MQKQAMDILNKQSMSSRCSPEDHQCGAKRSRNGLQHQNNKLTSDHSLRHTRDPVPFSGAVTPPKKFWEPDNKVGERLYTGCNSQPFGREPAKSKLLRAFYFRLDLLTGCACPRACHASRMLSKPVLLPPFQSQKDAGNSPYIACMKRAAAQMMSWPALLSWPVYSKSRKSMRAFMDCLIFSCSFSAF